MPAARSDTVGSASRPASVCEIKTRPRALGWIVCEWGSIAILLLLATALHVRFVTHVGGLWRDETNSVSLATLPSLAEIWQFLDYDSFPVLFFGVLRGWTTLFGADNDLALRALGLITGLGILGALWVNARAFGIKWPVLSFALIGLNPMLIRYGDSTRAYGLGIVLILLTFRSFWRLVDSPSPPPAKRILPAALLALLSVQCLYYNSVLLFAIAAGAMTVAFRQRAWRTHWHHSRDRNAGRRFVTALRADDAPDAGTGISWCTIRQISRGFGRGLRSARLAPSVHYLVVVQLSLSAAWLVQALTHSEVSCAGRLPEPAQSSRRSFRRRFSSRPFR